MRKGKAKLSAPDLMKLNKNTLSKTKRQNIA